MSGTPMKATTTSDMTITARISAVEIATSVRILLSSLDWIARPKIAMARLFPPESTP